MLISNYMFLRILQMLHGLEQWCKTGYHNNNNVKNSYKYNLEIVHTYRYVLKVEIKM